ncbi:MAG: permease [Acidimicrobiales bacterium]
MVVATELGSAILNGVLASVREAFLMFWDTIWALVLGFALSGAIQAFVTRAEMQRKLGGHRFGEVLRAMLYGMVSSSCSYAASAMARALVVQGADFISSMVFMFASTNLVLELGIVLFVLIGWEFLAAEFVGGIIMITLLVLLGALWFRGKHVVESDATRRPGIGVDLVSNGDAVPLRVRVRSRAGWTDAASYTMSDLAMLRKEMLIGFLVAGVLASTVPHGVWSAVFLHGHGWLTTLENALVGPLVAILSFVCSVGNIPLAAALWQGGISFGGVVSFIFADLITLPILLIYKKQYGVRTALRMLSLFWLVMSIAGLLTQGVFTLLGWIPPIRPTKVASSAFGVNLTSLLDVLALGVLGVLYWLYRNRDRYGSQDRYAKDVVCAMQVEIANAPASMEFRGNVYYFCSEHCRDRFSTSPDRFLGKSNSLGDTNPAPQTTAIDPICGMTVDPRTAPAHRIVGGTDYYFCNVGCAESFDREHEAQPAPQTTAIDPICGMTVDPRTAPAHRIVGGTDYYFCNVGCAESFDREHEEAR